jgi:ubiquitin carboxyl-terminal hydrolase 25/28
VTGLQQDSAEVLINVLSQLELAFDPEPTPADSGERHLNLIQRYVPTCNVHKVEFVNSLPRSLFSCKYRQQMFYQSESGAIEAQEPVESVFVHPIIGVEEEELYLRGSEIEYEGKKGYIMDLMDRFPPMLYIQMRVSVVSSAGSPV